MRVREHKSMITTTIKELKRKGVNIPKCNCGKLFKVRKLSNEELIKLELLKEDSKEDDIKKFFLKQEDCLHPGGITIIPDDVKLYPIKGFHLQLFAPHAYKVGSVFIVVIDQYVFEFKPKFRYKKFFVGGVTHALYAIFGVLTEDVKPVRVFV